MLSKGCGKAADHPAGHCQGSKFSTLGLCQKQCSFYSPWCPGWGRSHRALVSGSGLLYREGKEHKNEENRVTFNLEIQPLKGNGRRVGKGKGFSPFSILWECAAVYSKHYPSIPLDWLLLLQFFILYILWFVSLPCFSILRNISISYKLYCKLLLKVWFLLKPSLLTFFLISFAVVPFAQHA